MKTMALSTAALLAALPCGPAAAEEVMKLLAGTPDQIAAYAAGPEDAGARVLIIHDWFGLTPSTKAEAVWFGRQGIRAVAIDLYGGQVAATHEEAEKLMNGLDPDAAAKTIHNALEALGAGERPVTIIGYSMGGKLALQAQLADQEMISGAALVYGGGYEEIADAELKALSRPVFAASGSKDAGAVAAQEALQKRMSEFGHPIETYVYPGVDHAYAQALFNDGENFDLKAATATRNVVEDFVQRALLTEAAASSGNPGATGS